MLKTHVPTFAGDEKNYYLLKTLLFNLLYNLILLEEDL